MHLQGLEPWTHCIPLAVSCVVRRVVRRIANSESVALPAELEVHIKDFTVFAPRTGLENERSEYGLRSKATVTHA